MRQRVGKQHDAVGKKWSRGMESTRLNASKLKSGTFGWGPEEGWIGSVVNNAGE